jgi:hypothetical protein
MRTARRVWAQVAFLNACLGCASGTLAPSNEPGGSPGRPTPPSVSTDASPGDFDRAAALSTLLAARERARRDCSCPAGLTGQIGVKFGNSGTVLSAWLTARDDGTPAFTAYYECVKQIFGAISVPPFHGTPMTVRMTAP